MSVAANGICLSPKPIIICDRQVNRELAEAKRKHALETAVGDDVTAALEKERERLQVQIRVERAKAIKAEKEYKKLLQLVSKERLRFQAVSSKNNDWNYWTFLSILDHCCDLFSCLDGN